MLAIAAVLLAARLVGSLIARLSQPRVMGEVLAGILLGPTLLGAVWPEAQDYLFPPDIVPLLVGGGPDRPGLLPLPRRHGARSADPPRADRPGGVHLEHERRVPDGARLPGRNPHLQAAVARRSLPPVRPLHGRCDVGHRLPGARPHPDRAAHAETTCRRALDGGSRDRRRHRLVSPRARHGGRRHRQLVTRRAGDHPGCRLHRGDAPDRPPVAGPAVEGLRRGGRGHDPLARHDFRGRPALGLRGTADRDRRDLRLVRHGADHAAARTA